MVQRTGSRVVEVRLVAGLLLSLAAMSVVPQMVSQAQGSYAPIRVFHVSAQPAGGGTVVSIAADNPLRPTQNWQDGEGFHLVFPNTIPSEFLKSERGVRVRRVGTSLELLLQTKAGARVSVQPDGSHVNLIVDSNLEARPLEGDSRSQPNSSEAQRLDSTPNDPSSNSQVASGETAQTAGNWSPPLGPVANLPPEPFPNESAIAAPEATPSQIDVQAEDEGLAASIFSGTSVLIVMALGLFGLIVSRKMRSQQSLAPTAETPLLEDVECDDDAGVATLPELRGSQKGEQGSSEVKSGGIAARNGSSRQPVVRMPVAGPTSLYGAYRIDQEVGKLILGQPHRMDVLASRAVDDRRAIETSLIKGVNGVDLADTARRRAREALEEYGFVARQCAALLLSTDPFDRTSAARCLGEIKSEAALPFLLEGLYDSESIVRNQAVVSIGELKLPSAIGALLDIARTHPDVPSALLSRTLSACSVEGLDFFDAIVPELAQLGMGHDLSVVNQITHLEPSTSVEELPASCEDEELAQALSALESGDAHKRVEALKALAQFRVQSSVSAIACLARQESEPNIRSMAIASLGSIDHESVFPAILIGMADDTREVRAAAARALNRLSFDRADAYVRVIETSDEKTLRDVAQACIQAGIVSQNVDRLSSSDHRQAYETFSVICLLTKANMNEPILNAIASHSNLDVSLRAVHLLAATGQPGTFEQLRQLADQEGVREEVKTALLEALYKLDHTKLLEKEAVGSIGAGSEATVERSKARVEELTSDLIPTEFMPACQTESNPESPPEVEVELDRLEL